MIIDFSVILIVLSVVIILFIQNSMNIIILEMRYEHMQKGILKKLSLLSISLVLTSTTAIASAIPLMKETFIHQSLASIELITTMPSIMITIFVLLSVPISNRIGSKKTVIIGLLISIISSLVPMMIQNFIMILLSRAGLGIGFGLFNSLAISMINDFYDGNERVQMIGFQSAFQGMGSAILTFFAGQFLKINWQYSFAVYLIMIPILILFIVFVPDSPKYENSQKVKSSIQINIIKYVVLICMTLMIYNAVFLKIPTLIVEKNMGNAVDASFILTVVQIGSMLTGFLFERIYRIVKRNVLSLALILMAVSFAFISITTSFYMIVVCATMAGISFSLLTPYLFHRVAQISTVENQSLATSMLIVGAQIAGFISPYFLAVISQISLLDLQVAQVFLSGAIILLVILIVVLIYRSLYFQHNEEK